MKLLTKLAVASIIGGIKILLIIGALIISGLGIFHVIDSNSRVVKLADNFVENQTGIDIDAIEEKEIGEKVCE